jgi:hypothetical protein
MKTATSLSAAFILAGTFALTSGGLASKDAFASQMIGEIPSSVETANQEASELSRLASALSAGSEAMRSLRRSPGDEDEKDRLKSPLPGMDCGIDRIVNYLSCYSDTVRSEEEANDVFTRFVDALQSKLPSDSWKKVKTEPRIDSIRSYTYEDENSDAHIDIDLVARPVPEGANSYVVTIFGWPATEPRL